MNEGTPNTYCRQGVRFVQDIGMLKPIPERLHGYAVSGRYPYSALAQHGQFRKFGEIFMEILKGLSLYDRDERRQAEHQQAEHEGMRSEAALGVVQHGSVGV